ncbi:helix-turn-helix domain-containing protein [Poriferisphaera corsica]|nr:helix-turn-helix domain-containing protein [Poriferisphaera corsica]
MKSTDPAPALTRGLKIIHILANDGMCTLGQLAETTGWPKSSVLRLLRSLEMGGYVEREEGGRRYRGLVKLQTVNGDVAALKRLAAGAMQKLCKAAGHTVELHHFRHGRVSLIERIEPLDTEVTVRMRIGYEREVEEIDALMQVVAAHELGIHFLNNQQSWVWADGKQVEISKEKAAGLIEQADINGYGIDSGYNYGGVMRIAVPIYRLDQSLIAVLAIAQVCHPTMRNLDQAMIRSLKRIGNQLSDKVSQTM